MPTGRYDMAGVWVSRKRGPTWEHLQLLRAPGRYMPGVWSLCRGGIEPGETAVEAALRELREETGLTPPALYRMGTLEQFYTSDGDTVWHVPFFFAAVDADAAVRLNPEHTAFRWVSDGDAETLLTWPSELQLLAEVRRFHLADHPTRPVMRVR